MKTRRVICIGNRYLPGDDFGSRVYQRLAGGGLPGGVEVIDGGLAGLNLLRYFDDCARLVFVDAIHAPDDPKGLFIFAAEASAPLQAAPSSYGHAAGLEYLLHAARALPTQGDFPEVFVLGANGETSDVSIAQAAELCLQVALNGAGGLPVQSAIL